jgi:hypothetical protein
MESLVYALCASASLACFALLTRSAAASGRRLIWWTAFCFLFLFVQNTILFVDLAIVPNVDLSIWRTAAGFLGSVALLCALIWENR